LEATVLVCHIDRCVVSQYYSFVTMLGAGATRPNILH